MTTVEVPYVCGKCKNQFKITMKLGEPLVTIPCAKCGSDATAPPF